MTSAGTILVVDDDRSVVDNNCWLLRDWGYSAIAQTDPREVLADLERHPGIDLVLLDINMPEIDGWELLRQIKERLPAVGVIMVTVIDALDAVTMAVHRGAFDYIDKPFPVEQLAEKVKKWFRIHPRGSRTRLGDIVRRWRKEKGLSLEAAARKIGVTRFHLSRVERGHVGPLSAQHLHKMSQLTGIDESHLIRMAHTEKLLSAILGTPYLIRMRSARKVVANPGGSRRGKKRKARRMGISFVVPEFRGHNT